MGRNLKQLTRLTHEIQGKNLIFQKECNYFYFDKNIVNLYRISMQEIHISMEEVKN